jgi:hypothetical protein
MKDKKIILSLFLVLVLMLAANFFNFSSKNEQLGSRLWMEYVMDIVREEKPTPPESARLYAAVATSYHTCLLESKEKANACARETINYIYPNKISSTTLFITKNNLFVDEVKITEIVEQIKNRYTFDNSQKNTKKFYGKEFWVGQDPLSPTAPQWERWNLTNFVSGVVPPPKYLSEEYKKDLALVKDAANKRTSEQVTLINFWGGIPGTEAPAGIWQNRFYNETKKLNLSDKEYAYKQMILAQALADSFIECWTVKFQYYTKRPSMVDPSINLAMKDPNFPSYTSGHSTISATAATVLSHFFPEKKDIFMTDAVNAKNSRLWAGIHFPHDNEEGFKLGEKIGEFYISNVLK